MKITYYLLGIVLIFTSCTNKVAKLDDNQRNEYLKIGDSISLETQKILLSNVSRQIQQNGVIAALDFCNTHALSLTNTLTTKGIQVQRLTDKNRNPNNLIHDDLDRKAWEQLKNNFSSDNTSETLVLEDEDKVYYYKSIPLGMPACLNCHGSKQNEISAEVQEVLRIKYPDDRATDYKLGELRGMWKLTFERR
ncbi:MAG: DUF3365 domain-containing protein [Bacteroidota bacterium]|nr:DUF3365 domain-containing protein [Bacteroidota bacterium]